MSEDHLAKLPEPEVAAWYGRLAKRIGQQRVNGHRPLAAIFLDQWLKNRDPNSTYRFRAPEYLRNHSRVSEVLKFHRKVFLTKEKARFTSKPEAWAGIIPRLKGLAGFTKWDPSTILALHYESLVEFGSSNAEIVYIQKAGSDADKDLFTSLRGFQLSSDVEVEAAPIAGSKKLTIKFRKWTCVARDRYDFDPKEHFTVPNPDHGQTLATAVRPEDETITVYHKNAERIEKAGLASPFNVESEPWSMFDLNVKEPAEVDPEMELP